MDITVYLPDEIGSWAKTNDLNLSRLLRDAVEEEQDHRGRMKAWAGETAIHKLYVVDDNGNGYDVRLHAKAIAEDGRYQTLYVTEDEGVYVYHSDEQRIYDMLEALGDGSLDNWALAGDQGFYVAIMSALGEKAIIDIGKR